ncbi:Alpha/Beta hydrolase protein [Podospora australis]|uniref:Alpha/Beta hydrolase protein n=1 Tax=Podospora australis TaxID=1536484 RepID=A0AAN6WU55_9PEZI|nr:Alpha/Beta hydrolase protein [Podospora australis]
MNPTDYPLPPGQVRPYPPPTRTGTVLFRVPPTNNLAETSYSIWGNLSPKKTPLIVLHGGPGIPHDYLLPISLINSDYGTPVVMYDQLGCGRSTHFSSPAPPSSFWSIDLFIAELDNLIRSLGITTFDLLGHSWGGMLAVSFTLAQPTGLRKLVLCSTAADMATYVTVASELRSFLPPACQTILSQADRSSQDYAAAMLEFYRRHLCRIADPFPEELMRSLGEMANDNSVHTAMNGPDELHVTGSLKNWSCVQQLAGITDKTVPGGVLLINGQFDEAQDACVLPFFLRIKARVKWVQFALSAHMAQLEETEKFVRVVGAFLSTHS